MVNVATVDDHEIDDVLGSAVTAESDCGAVDGKNGSGRVWGALGHLRRIAYCRANDGPTHKLLGRRFGLGKR